MQPKSYGTYKSADYKRSDVLYQYISPSILIQMAPIGYIRFIIKPKYKTQVPTSLKHMIVKYYELKDGFVKPNVGLLNKNNIHRDYFLYNIKIHRDLLLYETIKTNERELIVIGAFKIKPELFLNNNMIFDWRIKYNTNSTKCNRYILGLTNLKSKIENPEIVGSAFDINNAQDGDTMQMTLKLITQNNYYQYADLEISQKAKSSKIFNKIWSIRLWNKQIGEEYPMPPIWTIYIKGCQMETKELKRSWTMIDFKKRKC